MLTVRGAIRLTLVAVLMGFGVAVIPAGPAWACSCVKQSEQAHFNAASVVFTGTATSQREDGRFYVFVFDVDDVMKGSVSDGVEVRATQVDVEGCGMDFTAAGDYQVFAYEEGGVLRTGLCTGTHRISPQQPVVQPTEGPAESPGQPSRSPTEEPPPTSSPTSVAPLPAETSRPPASVAPGTQTPSATPTSTPVASGPDEEDGDGSTPIGWLALLAGLAALGLSGVGYLAFRHRRAIG